MTEMKGDELLKLVALALHAAIQDSSREASAEPNRREYSQQYPQTPNV